MISHIGAPNGLETGLKGAIDVRFGIVAHIENFSLVHLEFLNQPTEHKGVGLAITQVSGYEDHLEMWGKTHEINDRFSGRRMGEVGEQTKSVGTFHDVEHLKRARDEAAGVEKG